MQETDARALHSYEGATAELLPDSRIVTRQQLRDRAFYAQVKQDLLDGKVTPLDQRADSLTIDGESVPLTDPRALQALAESQAAWVGKPVADPFLEGLLNAAPAK